MNGGSKPLYKKRDEPLLHEKQSQILLFYHLVAHFHLIDILQYT